MTNRITGLVLLFVGFTGCTRNATSTPEAAAESPAAASSYFMYVANVTGQSISVFSLDPTGAQPVVTLVDTVTPDVLRKPWLLKANPAKTHLFVSENNINSGGEGGMRIMSIDQATGALASTYSFELTNDYVLRNFGFDRTGTFLFASNFNTDTRITPLAVSTALDSMTEGTDVVAGTQLQIPQPHPSLDRMYVSSIGTNQIFAFSYDSTTGALTQTQAITSSGSQPRGIAIHPNGEFAVAYHGASTSVLSNLSIDGSGTMTTGTAVTQSIGNNANFYDLTFHPTLNFAYAVAFGPEKIVSFTVDPTLHTLTEVGTPVSTGSTGANPYSLKIDPTGKFAFVPNSGAGTVSVFLIDQSTGELTAADTPTFTVGTGPQYIEIIEIAGN